MAKRAGDSPKSSRSGLVIPSVIGGIAVVVGAIITVTFASSSPPDQPPPDPKLLANQKPPKSRPLPTHDSVRAPDPDPAPATGGIRGFLSNASGKPLRGVLVRVRGADMQAKETTTDHAGSFTFEGVTAGLHRVEFKSPTSNKSIEWDLRVELGPDTLLNAVCDTDVSMLGMLQIDAPVDDGEVRAKKDADLRPYVEVFGRCSSLDPLLGKYSIWIIAHSATDPSLWIQKTPVVCDRDGRWHATVMIGRSEADLIDGQGWTIFAVAAKSEFDTTFVNNDKLPRMSSLPEHVSSNSVTLRVKR